MTASARLGQDLARLLGAPISAVARLHGGDLSDVFQVTLADGQKRAVKQGERVASEGRMLNALARAGAPVPPVLASQGDLLCLDWLEEEPPSQSGWARLGASLRALHDGTCPAKGFGWEEDYAFGTVPIPNAWDPAWPAFWSERRLRVFRDQLPNALARRLDTLIEDLPARLDHRPRAALLHGDLWQGNIVFASEDTWLIDPACYYGDPEVDLAMLTLFGSPPPAFWQAYGKLQPGWRQRRAIYQLWPALVHLSLFGTGYASMVDGLLSELGC